MRRLRLRDEDTWLLAMVAPSGVLGILREFVQLPDELSEVLLPYVLVSISLFIGAKILLPPIVQTGNSRFWSSRLILTLSLVLIGLSLLYKPVARYPDLWHGFGAVVTIVSFSVAGLWLILVRNQSVIKRMRLFFNGLTITILIGVYLPALIQPPWGFVNLGDASHQVLEEISGVLVGHFPGVNFVSTYTTLLGTPLVLLRPVRISPSVEMLIVVLWVNVLTLLVPTLMVLTTRRVLALRSVVLPAFLVVAPLMVSGNWGTASSNVESLSMIPGRTLLPLVLGLFVLSATKRDTQKHWFLVGVCCIATAYNNIEFGVPAVFSVILLLLCLGSWTKTASATCPFLGGLVAGSLIILIYSVIVSGPLDLWYRVGSYAGRPYSPANPFPIWSTHNLLLALFFMAVVLGLRERRNKSYASSAALYFGGWGFFAFPYCSYRCEPELYMSTQVYLVPAILCGVGIVGIYLEWRRQEPTSHIGRKQDLFVGILMGISVATILQAPNPIDEWRRVGGRAESMPWALDSDRALPNEWSSKKIDWIDVKTLKNLRKELSASEIGYFGHMGNSVELATGINNLTRINSSEVLQIKGTQRLEELACKEVDDTYPELIVVVGIDFPCNGYFRMPPLEYYPQIQIYRSRTID